MSTEAAIKPLRAMLDHPGWLSSSDGRVRRAFSHNETVWTVVCEPSGDMSTAVVDFHPHASGDTGDVPAKGDVFDPAVLPPVLRTSHPVRDAGCVHRVRNPDLWDALLPPLLHQRTRATDAGRMYRRLCEAHGRVVSTESGPALLAPRPEIVAGLSDTAFNAIRLRGKAESLRTAANAYLSRSAGWTVLSPGELYAELLAVPGVGRWTAGVAIADVTNDFSFYAFTGLAVFARWQEMFTAIKPDLTAEEFREAWRQLDRQQLSTLVLLALASAQSPVARDG